MADTTLVVGLGSCGIAAGAQSIYDHFTDSLQSGALHEAPVNLEFTSCIGMCYAEPIVEVRQGDEKILFGNVDAAFADKIAEGITRGELPEENRIQESDAGKKYLERQVKIVLRNCGVIDPESIQASSRMGASRARPP